MSQEPTPSPIAPTAAARGAAFGVHVLTATGAALAFLAMLEAVREHWVAMFAWLGVALVVDGLDGPLARHFNVASLLPDWSGDTLDLVVDFTTYVFVPAYAIVACHLLLPVAGPLVGVGVVISGALYFADRRMKVADNHFRGFPTLWNAAAFYLLLLKPSPVIATLGIAALVALTFVPIHVVHPVRTTRLRPLTLGLVALWAVLAIWCLASNFDVDWLVTAALCAIAAYLLFIDSLFRAVRLARS